jgi:ElaB/YqjD/DUF883 family membrane-anchored ribosome-binding protein
LQKIQEENEKLRKEREELIKQSSQPPEELLKAHASASSHLDKQKELFRGRNEEIEALIEQVLKKQGDKSLAVDGHPALNDD